MAAAPAFDDELLFGGEDEPDFDDDKVVDEDVEVGLVARQEESKAHLAVKANDIGIG